MGKTAVATCDDCYFRRSGLCALRVDCICPTFRPVSKSGSLVPPKHPVLVLLPQGLGVHAPLTA